MFKVNIVVCEGRGSKKPSFSLDFNLPQVPSVGDYISIQRPDVDPYCEDVIVRHVWWLLLHPEAATVDSGLIGQVDTIFVECDPATGPWSSDRWRDDNYDAPVFDVDRLQRPTGFRQT